MARRLYSESREKLRELLRKARVDAGLSQSELAEKLSRPQSYVSDYERGHRRLDFVAVDEVVVACGSTIALLARSYQSAVHDSKHA